jgi:predicted 2-oxoglutarate/Fe(II)-dependent dioxygenase YbiX
MIYTYPIYGNRVVQPIYVIPNALSINEINYLDSFVMQEEIEEGVGKDKQTLDIRNNVGVVWLKDDVKYSWLYIKIAGLINKANTENYNFSLSHMETLQYTMYNDISESYYGQHVDQIIETSKPTKRKLSFSLQLTDPRLYTGGELEIYNATDFVTPKNIGHMIFFESNTLHEVKQVTSGARHSLVGWIHGPNI